MRAHRFVFVCGLHRSGTTLIARALSRHALVSGFKNTGAIEDEGQFLQSVFPLETAFGGVGRFGFDPRAHMTETSEFNTRKSAMKLRAEWNRYWDLSKPVLLEKTPSNLLRMRLLAQLFKDSQFIVVIRHPVAAALATMKWTEGNVFSLLSHWLHCHRIARADGEGGRVLWVSYEGFVRDTVSELARMWRFLSLEPQAGSDADVRDENAKYFEMWNTRFLGDMDRTIEQLPSERRRSLFTRARERIVRDAKERELPVHRQRANRRNFHDALDAVVLFEASVNEFGYSLIDLSRAF
jgi:sulfotransferase family protein